jgi:hypothetical protein
MAERPQLLAMTVEIVSAHGQVHRRRSRSAIRADPAGLQRAGYRRTGSYCDAKGRTGCRGEAFGVPITSSASIAANISPC